jgi:hypothetical protein
VLQLFPVALDDVKVTVPPLQKVVGPLVATTGVLGNGLITTVVFAELEEHPAAPTVTE